MTARPKLTPPQIAALAVLGRVARGEICFDSGEPAERVRLSTRTTALRPWALKVNANATRSLEQLGLVEVLVADLYGFEARITKAGVAALAAIGKES